MSDPGLERGPAEAGRPLGLTERQAALVAWSGAWVTGLLCLWIEPNQPFVRHHALHAVVLLGGLMALALGLWGACLLAAFVSPSLFRGLAWAATAAWGLFAAAWLAGIVTAIRHRACHLPWLTARIESVAGQSVAGRTGRA